MNDNPQKISFTKNTFVAFFDILGFKELVKNNDHKILLEIDKLLSRIHSNSLGGFKEKKSDGKVIDNLSNVRVNSFQVSDSIILWTNEVSAQEFSNIIHASRELMHSGFKAGLPLRGAIVLGSLTFEHSVLPAMINIHSTFLGKSIVDAYEICESQEWCGCVISKKCIEDFNTHLGYESDVLKGLEEINYVRKSIVPYKKDLQEDWIIDWIKVYSNYMDNKVNESRLRSKFSEHGKVISEKVEPKIKNTYQYLIDSYKTKVAL